MPDEYTGYQEDTKLSDIKKLAGVCSGRFMGSQSGGGVVFQFDSAYDADDFEKMAMGADLSHTRERVGNRIEFVVYLGKFPPSVNKQFRSSAESVAAIIDTLIEPKGRS